MPTTARQLPPPQDNNKFSSGQQDTTHPSSLSSPGRVKQEPSTAGQVPQSPIKTTLEETGKLSSHLSPQLQSQQLAIKHEQLVSTTQNTDEPLPQASLTVTYDALDTAITKSLTAVPATPTVTNDIVDNAETRVVTSDTVSNAFLPAALNENTATVVAARDVTTTDALPSNIVLIGPNKETNELQTNQPTNELINENSTNQQFTNAQQDPLAVQQNPLAVQQDLLAVQQDLLAVQQDPLAVQQDLLAAQQDPLAVQQDPLAVQRQPSNSFLLQSTADPQLVKNMPADTQLANSMPHPQLADNMLLGQPAGQLPSNAFQPQPTDQDPIKPLPLPLDQLSAQPEKQILNLPVAQTVTVPVGQATVINANDNVSHPLFIHNANESQNILPGQQQLAPIKQSSLTKVA